MPVHLKSSIDSRFSHHPNPFFMRSKKEPEQENQAEPFSNLDRCLTIVEAKSEEWSSKKLGMAWKGNLVGILHHVDLSNFQYPIPNNWYIWVTRGKKYPCF